MHDFNIKHTNDQIVGTSPTLESNSLCVIKRERDTENKTKCKVKTGMYKGEVKKIPG